jgi:hypothetical protein
MTYRKHKVRKDRKWLSRVLWVKHVSRISTRAGSVYRLPNPWGCMSRRRTCMELHDQRMRVLARRKVPCEYGMSPA